jgi:hypothetical protein
MMSEDELPDVGTVIAPVLLATPIEQQPLLIAMAERLAADRYRRWADEVTNARQRADLRACAAREEDIARRIETLHPGAAEVQRRLRADHPALVEIDRDLFAGRPLRAQFTIQARGERLGAATWRAFAKRTADASGRAVFLACAELEEASALVLEAILAEPDGA